MTTKFNSDASCFDSTFSDELLGQCKKATSLAVKGTHSSEEHPLPEEHTVRGRLTAKLILLLMLSLLFSTSFIVIVGVVISCGCGQFLVGVVCVIEGIFWTL